MKFYFFKNILQNRKLFPQSVNFCFLRKINSLRAQKILQKLLLSKSFTTKEEEKKKNTHTSTDIQSHHLAKQGELEDKSEDKWLKEDFIQFH